MHLVLSPDSVPSVLDLPVQHGAVTVPTTIRKKSLERLSLLSLGTCSSDTVTREPWKNCGSLPRVANEENIPGVLYCCPAGDPLPVFSARGVFVSGRGTVFDNRTFYGAEGDHEAAYNVALDKGAWVPVLPRAFNLLQIWSDNYYHTIVDVLAFMWQMRDLLRAHREIPILFRKGLRLHDLLALLDWTPGDIGPAIRCHRTVYYYADTLYFPSRGRYLNATLVDWEGLRAHFFTNSLPRMAGITPPRAARSLHIVVLKRFSQSGRRTLINSALLERAILDRYGASRVTIFNGTQTLVESMRIFSTATLMVGPHGAGFSNMIFAPAGAVVLEVMPDRYQQWCFRHLAERIGLRHHHVMGAGNAKGPLQADIVGIIDRVTELASLFDP